MNIWSKKWLMSFNPEKTEIMVYSNFNIKDDVDFSFNGENVAILFTHKHLGVIFSDDS